jgi:regulator of RNase E activity RraB
MRAFLLMISLFSFLFGSGRAADGESADARAKRIEGDRAVIQSLKEHHSDLSKPHRIEFHFVGYDHAKVIAASEEGAKMGFELSKIDTLADKQGVQYWYFDLIRDVVPSEKNVTPVTARMAELGRKHGIEYDGWGCLIVK